MATSFSIRAFLSLLLVQLGVHPMSAVESWAGVASSIYALPAALLSPVWGYWADRTGRKAMVVRTCIAASLINAATGFAQNEWQLTGVQIVQGCFGGFTAAAMALVGTQVPEKRLGYAMGLLATGQLVGTLVGPLIGGLLADWLHNYRTVFFVTAGGALICALGCAAFVQEHDARPATAEGRPREPLWKSLGAYDTTPFSTALHRRHAGAILRARSSADHPALRAQLVGTRRGSRPRLVIDGLTGSPGHRLRSRQTRRQNRIPLYPAGLLAALRYVHLLATFAAPGSSSRCDSAWGSAESSRPQAWIGRSFPRSSAVNRPDLRRRSGIFCGPPIPASPPT